MRDELWQALAEASHALGTSFLNWKTAPTPANGLTLEAAIRGDANLLGPVIGHEAAFQFEAAYQAFVEAMDRHQALLATFAARPTLDESDVALMRGLQKDYEDAVTAFEVVEAATLTRIDVGRNDK